MIISKIAEITGLTEEEIKNCSILKSIPFLIHHANPFQTSYEEDILELYGNENIIGHFRISQSKNNLSYFVGKF